ncbi:Resolvase domain protein, partial [mine drainage metagenome]
MANTYSIGEFAKRIGRSPSTLRRWEQEGKITPKRLPSGHRYFDESDVRAMLGGAPLRRVTVVYCRVSGSGQKDDLASQVKAMETYCLNAGIAVDEWIEEIGGGMNFKRKKFLTLIDRIQH